MASFLLERFDDTTVEFIDCNAANLAACARLQRDAARVACRELDVGAAPGGELIDRLSGAACVISCVPYALNVRLTEAAIAARTPFTDLGGNVGTVAAQLAMADACRDAGIAIAPDCGLAPGLLNVLAEYWANAWEYRSVRLYCGGLPQNPHGLLKYALTFNVCGLFNEYFDDCEVSRGGRLIRVPGMSEVERLTDLALPGLFEAFATSGGASLGAKLAAARGVDYQYKTIRYPGHRDIIVSMWEQGFFDAAEREYSFGGQRVRTTARDLSAAVMAGNLKSDGKDLVVARAEVEGAGAVDGRRRRGRIDLIDYAVDRFTAMERTTGFPTAITAAALAGMYPGHTIAPGAYVPLQIIDPRLMIAELSRAGVKGLTVREL